MDAKAIIKALRNDIVTASKVCDEVLEKYGYKYEDKEYNYTDYKILIPLTKCIPNWYASHRLKGISKTTGKNQLYSGRVFLDYCLYGERDTEDGEYLDKVISDIKEHGDWHYVGEDEVKALFEALADFVEATERARSDKPIAFLAEVKDGCRVLVNATSEKEAKRALDKHGEEASICIPIFGMANKPSGRYNDDAEIVWKRADHVYEMDWEWLRPSSRTTKYIGFRSE